MSANRSSGSQEQSEGLHRVTRVCLAVWTTEDTIEEALAIYLVSLISVSCFHYIILCSEITHAAEWADTRDDLVGGEYSIA